MVFCGCTSEDMTGPWKHTAWLVGKWAMKKRAWYRGLYYPVKTSYMGIINYNESAIIRIPINPTSIIRNNKVFFFSWLKWWSPYSNRNHSEDSILNPRHLFCTWKNIVVTIFVTQLDCWFQGGKFWVEISQLFNYQLLISVCWEWGASFRLDSPLEIRKKSASTNWWKDQGDFDRYLADGGIKLRLITTNLLGPGTNGAP